MSGVTPSGFESKRLADILAEATTELAQITDPVTGDRLQPDFSGADPAMQIALVPLSLLAEAWEEMAEVYNQFDPDKASEAALASLIQLNGLRRLDAAPSRVSGCTFAGTPGVTIAAGQTVSDADGVHSWTTDADVVLNGAGNGTGNVTCTTTGPVTIAPTTIVTPVAGWASFTPGTLVVGRDLETPAQMRVRRGLSTMAPAAGPVDAVFANLANVEGVTYARVYQNNTLTTDGRGIPGKSVAAVVVGGADADIAATLLARTGVTAAFYGAESFTLYDENGEAYPVQWTRPAALDVYVSVQIAVTNPTVFPADGVDQIKAAVLAYVQGGAPALGITDGFGTEGFGPGATVERSRLYTPINFVPGHKVQSLTLGTAPAPVGTADIATPWNQYPRFTDANIDVTVVT